MMHAYPAIVLQVYDGVFEIALCLTEKSEGMQFCQTQIWPDFLSRLSFCQDIPNEFLSQFKDILSNTGGYIDSVLFCQSLQSCLTEQFDRLTESHQGSCFACQNHPKMSKKQKNVIISNTN